MDQGIINFKVYEDGVEYAGMAKVSMPDLKALTQSISGAGIAGNAEAVFVGHYEAMTLGLEFRTITDRTIKLAEPRRHSIDLRVAQQNENPATGELEIPAVKHVFVVIPKSFKGGSVAPASTAGASGEFAVRYWATFIDGVKVLEIDPVNFICYMDGVDYLASTKKALGM